MAFELQTMLLAARPPPKKVPGYSGGTDYPRPGEETKVDQNGGAVRNQATSEVTDPMGGRQKMTTNVGNEM
jgi:hypothetical protein